MNNVSEYIASVEKLLENKPPVRQLRTIRDNFDDPAFETELVRYIRGINDPEILSEILSRMRRIRRSTEEMAEKRKTLKDLAVQTGVAGGVALIGGSIVAAATATVPLLILIPIFGGVMTSGMGGYAAQKLDQERHIYEQISGLMADFIKKVQS